MTSYGTALPDSSLLVASHSDSLISLLPTISSFLAHRATLERDYAKALSTATSKARLVAIKESSERSGGGDKSGTLEGGWLKVLEAADWDARQHLARADALTSGVVDCMSTSAVLLERVRKKHAAFATKLLAERDRVYSERDKAKHRYFTSCESLEAARVKKSISADGKTMKAYDAAVDDMEITKNEFLLSTSLANAAKARLYNTDLPALHDDFQLLEQSTISSLVHLLLKFVEGEKESLAKYGDNVGVAQKGIEGINIEEDQKLFVSLHSAGKLAGWELPRDLEFEESPVWHDTSQMVMTESAINHLLNVKMKALVRLAEISPAIESKRREIAGLRNLRDAYETNRSLGEVGSVLENLFDSTRTTVLTEMEQTSLRSQVELITANLPSGTATTLTLHAFKSSSFVTPVPCAACDSTLWGKGLTCKSCGVNVHTKCELKVPAGCSGVAGSGLTRSKSRKTSGGSTAPSSSGTSMMTTRSDSSDTLSLPSPRRAVPPPLSPPSPMTTASEASAEDPATALYTYAATTAFEISVEEGEVVVVVEGEDGEGWSKVRTKDGRVGLVPASYLQLGGDPGPAAEEEGRGSGQRVVVLYDYAAQTDDEMSVEEGEYLELTTLGTDFGEGWAEVLKEGRVGLVPSTYIENA